MSDDERERAARVIAILAHLPWRRRISVLSAVCKVIIADRLPDLDVPPGPRERVTP